MAIPREKRLNSLLKEVISEVIMQDVRNPNIAKFISVTQVDITKDLMSAKVYISILGTLEEKNKTIAALNSAAGFIGIIASKKVVMRHFPSLVFKLDSSVDEHLKIDKILQEIEQKKIKRSS
ncbi:MAG: 30S ribosome-binding factor RbfA [Chlamydiae bacterium]|nr:30S ribosome-binding factor RbfA [Chlamydiota bacterium]